MSLAEQGGPFTPEEANAFAAWPFAPEADNCGPSTTTGRLRGLTITARHLSTHVGDALAAHRPIDPAWARDACRCPSPRPRQRPTPHRCDCVGRVDDRLVSPSRGELQVVLHHESGERHECRIPLAVRSSVHPDPGRSTPQTSFATPAPTGTMTAPLSSTSPDEGSHSSMAAGSSRHGADRRQSHRVRPQHELRRTLRRGRRA